MIEIRQRIAVIAVCAVAIVIALTVGLGMGIGKELNIGMESDFETGDSTDATLDPSVDTDSATVPSSQTTSDTTQPQVTTPEASETEAVTQLTAGETTTQPSGTEPDLPDPQPPTDATARICLGGDTSIDTEFADAAYKWGINYPWKEVIEIFSSADISVVNLETCVSNRGESEKREGYGFRTPPDMLEGFVNAGIDLVNLANNHTRDFGYDALLDTFAHLGEYGIGYFGAGNDITEAQGLAIKEVNGIKIGFTGCNYVWLADDCAADVDHAGVNMVYGISDERTQAYLAKVREYDSQCDVLITFMHCGTEEVFDVNSYQERLSRALIDNGADIVVGAHPHTLQPIEFYNGKPIFYSIGNLIFWHIDDDLDGLTCIFDITVDKNGFSSLKVYPLFIKNYKVYLLDKEEDSQRYYQIIELMNSLCNPYGIAFDDDGNMTEYVLQPEPEDTAMAEPAVTTVPQGNSGRDKRGSSKNGI